MFYKKIIWLILCGVLSYLTSAELVSPKEESSPPEQGMYRAAAVVGGGLAALCINFFLPQKEFIKQFILLIPIAPTTIFIALRIVDLLQPRIQKMSASKKIQSFITFSVATYVPFFILFISWISIAYGFGGLEQEMEKEVEKILYSSILPAFGISLGLNMIGFFIAYRFHTDKLTDLSYALTFSGITLGLYLLHLKKLNGYLHLGIVTMVLLWAFRLGSFLLKRILKEGKDARFDKFRAKFWRFGGFWLLQGLSVPIILLPAILFLTREEKNISSFPLQFFSSVAICISLLGLFIEHVADEQKSRFKEQKEHKGKWINEGLWRYSRHPNYFGEMLFWCGFYLAIFPYLSPLGRVFGALGPLYIISLLSFMSGIPILEDRADERWGKDEKYQAYKRRTSILVPWLVRSSRGSDH